MLRVLKECIQCWDQPNKPIPSNSFSNAWCNGGFDYKQTDGQWMVSSKSLLEENMFIHDDLEWLAKQPED